MSKFKAVKVSKYINFAAKAEKELGRYNISRTFMPLLHRYENI